MRLRKTHTQRTMSPGTWLSRVIKQALATGEWLGLFLRMLLHSNFFSFETIGPLYQEMPRFLKKTKYQNPSDHYHSVFQDAWKTELGAFEWFKYHPMNLEYFNQYMAFRREGAETWLSVYPVEEEAKLWDPEAPVFVNVGGGIGHQCAEFKAHYPQVAGRVILQDLPHTIDRALQTPGVENMAHNFFESQPIRGIYYFLKRDENVF